MNVSLTEEGRKRLFESFEPNSTDGHFNNDAQEWSYKSDESMPCVMIRKHKDGMWYETGLRSIPYENMEKPYEFVNYN